ncbi:MAG: flagellar hook-basal body complex protein [Lachnospiraceae bacterium]|nr:flagellar hook-basal body complex protein [Lachnospiraceae bacterium]
MMRSLYSGVSGLRTHQTRMDVIGNNIANVNTTAFKAKQMNFSDMLYQTTQAGTAANAANGTGGTNPRQIGLGVKTAAINTTITQEGANQSTGNPFDLKLTGEAFFVVSDGTNTFYTRDGSFDVDDAGNLVMASTGYIVQGWGVDQNGNIVQGSLGGINVTAMDTFKAASTTQARIHGIVDSNDGELENEHGKQVTVPVYDKAGYTYNLKFGILPVTANQVSTRDINNTEIEYNLGNIVKVDMSKLTYSYTVKVGTPPTDEKRYLSDSFSPDIMEAMEKQIWSEIQAGTEKYVKGLANYTLDNHEGITFELDSFLNDNYKDAAIDAGSLLNEMSPLTVNFSGETGYMRASDFNGYPLSEDASPVKVSDDALTDLFGTPTTNPNKTITYTPTSASVVSIQQTYVDDNDKSQTDYIFRKSDGSEITVNANLQSDVARLLRYMGNESKTNSYLTQEDKTISSPEKGRFTISLLGMTDSNNADVDISRLLNGSTSSWDLVFNTGDGQFSYVGQEGSDAFTVNLSALGDNFDNVSIDISDTSNVDNEKKCSLEGDKLDGRRVGTRSGVSIGTDGVVTALYSNGMSRKLGQICVGTFPNAMGLENAGDNLYQVTASSGDVSIVDIRASGTGSITTGVLEMSNVDLSQQFTDMITTQRGFQANSRIITTSDSLLEELVNLKR